MNIFRRSSSRRRSSGASSSGDSARKSYVESDDNWLRDAHTKSCLWPCNDFMTLAGIKEDFERYIHNTELGPYIEDKCTQYLNLTKTFTKHFKFFSRECRVTFNLYDHSFAMSLVDFSRACRLPLGGSLDEPTIDEYEAFLTSICYGEGRGVTQGRIKSIHFPAIQYFALFNGKCVVGKQDCSTLCAHDLSLIHTALSGERRYNLGAIVARRLQLNACGGNFYGGIYATRVARALGISAWQDDPIVPTQYLDFDAMFRHKFLKGKPSNFTYNLRFDNEDVVQTYLPAPALFDFNRRGRYFILKSEALTHNAEFETARERAAAPRGSVSFHSNFYADHGW